MAELAIHITAIAEEFTNFYYKTFDQNRRDLAPLYRPQSILTFENESTQGGDEIIAKLASLPFTRVAHQVATLDAQLSTLHPQLPILEAKPSVRDYGILVMVTGVLLVDEEQRETSYTQAFQLLPNGAGSYFVFNDVFRIVYPREVNG